MYIAMNRFKVVKGSEEAFETLWRSRESYLHELPGFVEFTLLRGPEKDDYTLYSSHTVWKSQENFKNWTTSDQFRKSHARASNSSPGAPLYVGHPEFEGFQAVLVQRGPDVTDAAA
ncbi:antibiotic biosynthesis monooxygenase [Terrarubrum flagellatum]|uniref:antibiotic biosynthesis monooxygenase family protein n=1 Tax=Terrirubrum flagellatum TaxID=2895980 RepID=UPI0031450388